MKELIEEKKFEQACHQDGEQNPRSIEDQHDRSGGLGEESTCQQDIHRKAGTTAH